tara:strand:- start:2650 stop:3183 length:534 start_codon:yes stop_codon:yes gene_type:complete
MWKYGDITIRENCAWTDSDGIQHPRNWHIWSAEEKAAAGLTEVIPETPPDSRLYTWSQNANGTINKTAKALDDSGSGDDLVKGVKTSLKDEVNTQQGALLSLTDWYVIRKADKGIAIPDNVQEYRDAIRAKGDAMKAAIDDAADTAAVAALFLTRTIEEDGSKSKSGILYDWPELDR